MQTARAYAEALTAYHRRTHADTARTETGRIYWYDTLSGYGDLWCTPVYTVDARLPVCDEVGCQCSLKAARPVVADRGREWQSRPEAHRIRLENTHVYVIFEGPNGPQTERQN
ncbi:hypothetical protein P1P68_05880 [Streptomyces scabiei]|uniref:hypothetical protein n=1 Tax=Streptomyces scabiei TaxID=1930 RepID=UPI00299080E6|nr:hypothetical protein [Streptomyces scabiei]MDW8804331.1 hypothetical protein [Streptomyces scabiei]